MFLKGSDVAVEANGVILGGVISAEVQENYNYYELKEFLCDEAYDTVKSQSYTITLTMNISDGDIFSGGVCFDILTLMQGSTRTRFEKARVLEVSDKVEGANKAVRTVRLLSEERQVLTN